jgi:hypothetical protein
MLNHGTLFEITAFLNVPKIDELIVCCRDRENFIDSSEEYRMKLFPEQFKKNVYFKEHCYYGRIE